LGDAQELYEGAASACLALFNGKQDRWKLAEDALRSIDSPPTACLDKATYDLLASAVEQHRLYPNATFKIKGSSRNIKPPCPVISKLDVTGSAVGGLDIAARVTQFGHLRSVTYEQRDRCPTDDAGVGGTPIESDQLQATDGKFHISVPSDEVQTDFNFLVLGLMADPEPWFADIQCVEIAGNPAVDSSPTPSI